MIPRAVLFAGMIMMANFCLSADGRRATPHSRTGLASVPLVVGDWRGVERPPLDAAIRRTLGADEYMGRLYANAAGSAVDVYIAYYASQRQGDAIHSPRHCLPGNGWQPITNDLVTFASVDGRIISNRIVVEKSGERQTVYYWYHGRGRTTPSEYANKAFLLVDALRLNRTDGSLVRLMTPQSGVDADGLVSNFITWFLPHLRRALP
jgi:EpsI family protein